MPHRYSKKNSKKNFHSHSKKPDLNTIEENSLFGDPEDIRQSQRQAMINVGIGVFVAAAKYGAMGGLSTSYFTNRNKNASLTVGIVSSVLAACCNFYSGKVSEDEQTRHDYEHVHNVLNDTIEKFTNRIRGHNSLGR